MRPKSVLVLFVIVVALLAFIWFYERELPSSDERGELAKKALLFDRSEIEQIELEREGQRVRLVRIQSEPDAEEGDVSLGFFEDEWRLEEPFAGRADVDLVNGLLDALESVEKLRQLEGMGASEAGLDSPRATLLLHTDAGITELAVGSEVPASETMIVRVNEDDPQVVSNSLWSHLSEEPGNWRSKDLYLGERDAIHSVVLETETARIRLARRGDSFWIEEPLEDRADRERIRALLGSIVGLRVHAFIDEPEDSLADLGLDPPVATVEVAALDGQQEFRLDWGLPVSEDATRSFARVGEQIFETSTPLAEYLVSSPEEWRSLALTTFETHQIDSVRVLNDEGELELRRAGADWQRNDERISFTAVSDLLYSLVEAKASGFDSTVELADADAGQAEPHFDITLSDGQREQVLSLGQATGGGIAVRSSDREAILVLEAEVLNEIRQKLAEVRAAEPVGGESSTSTTEIQEDSDDETQ